jgi:hypothetical protein
MCSMFRNCGELQIFSHSGPFKFRSSQKTPLLEKLSDMSDVVTWNVMIFGLLKCWQVQKAMEIFWQIQQEGKWPHQISIICLWAALQMQQCWDIHSDSFVQNSQLCMPGVGAWRCSTSFHLVISLQNNAASIHPPKLHHGKEALKHLKQMCENGTQCAHCRITPQAFIHQTSITVRKLWNILKQTVPISHISPICFTASLPWWRFGGWSNEHSLHDWCKIGTLHLHGNLLGHADSLQETEYIKEMPCKPYVVVVWGVDACCFDVCVCDNAAQDKDAQ